MQEICVLLNGSFTFQELGKPGDCRHEALGGLLHQAVGIHIRINAASSLLINLSNCLHPFSASMRCTEHSDSLAV